MVDETTAIEKYQDVKRVELCLQILEYQLKNPRCTQVEACDTVGVPERTFRYWLSQGILDDWLAEYADSMVRTGRNQVLDSWGNVLGYMVKIATGAVEVKGANPVSAADFLRKVAGIKFSVTEQPQAIAEMTIFMLPQVHIGVKDGKPVLDSPSDIVSGEFRDITDSPEASDQAPPSLESCD